MGYRENWFKHNKPNAFGRYRCASCHKMFPKSKIEIDHRISKRLGGTDDLWNLQPMCRSCNRSKRERSSTAEVASTLIRATAHGSLGKAVGNMALRGVKDTVGIKYKRR